MSHETFDLHIRRRKPRRNRHRRDQHRQQRSTRIYHAGTNNYAHNTPYSNICSIRFNGRPWVGQSNQQILVDVTEEGLLPTAATADGDEERTAPADRYQSSVRGREADPQAKFLQKA